MNLNPIDDALQRVVPTVMVPRHAELEKLNTPGHRILMAGNGVWLEVRRAWLYLRVMLTLPLQIAVPYGIVKKEFCFTFGKLPKAMVAQFIEEARARMPNECAGWVIWNESTGAWRLQMLPETSVGVDHVNVNLPVLGDLEHLIVDMHSHGKLPAFFSETDNHDDRGEVKISGVIGNLNRPCITAKFRVCANGVFIPIHFN